MENDMETPEGEGEKVHGGRWINPKREGAEEATGGRGEKMGEISVHFWTDKIRRHQKNSALKIKREIRPRNKNKYSQKIKKEKSE